MPTPALHPTEAWEEGGCWPWQVCPLKLLLRSRLLPPEYVNFFYPFPFHPPFQLNRRFWNPDNEFRNGNTVLNQVVGRRRQPQGDISPGSPLIPDGSTYGSITHRNPFLLIWESSRNKYLPHTKRCGHLRFKLMTSGLEAGRRNTRLSLDKDWTRSRKEVLITGRCRWKRDLKAVHPPQTFLFLIMKQFKYIKIKVLKLMSVTPMHPIAQGQLMATLRQSCFRIYEMKCHKYSWSTATLHHPFPPQE